MLIKLSIIMEDSHSDAYKSDVSGNVVNSQAESYTSEGKPSNKGKKKASDVWNYSVNMHASLEESQSHRKYCYY